MKKTATFTVRLAIKDLSSETVKKAKLLLLNVPGVKTVIYEEHISKAENQGK